ncbi:MAG: biotin/lipoyl-binding protein [Planctomycetes bacterium]|nr:biotin/lipoyl-binding protein [Planctomycetota bacterium]
MIAPATALVSSTTRPLTLRTRGDLVVRRQQYQGEVAWIVKDPLKLSYFRFRDEEYALLTMFDGRVSLDDIRQQFERQFMPRRISVEEIARFIGELYRSGLIVADVPGQAEQFRKRQDENQRKKVLTAASSVLALRLPVFDPDRLLTWLDRCVGWFFSPAAIVASIGLILSAVLLVAVQFDVFLARLPAFHQFFAQENWLAMATMLALAKILHEFGHGLSCKHFGGECHEMGAMLLVFTPCLYCNVSDSWMLRNKWQRAAVGAAGMYVELVLASVATFIWWNSAPGLVNQLCLSLMFVSSVSTLVFNANPLLKYDGYYILSDLLEVPNLRQKAAKLMHRKLGAWCLGLPEAADPMLPQRGRGWFGLYAIAATLYGWVLLFSILWFLNNVFEPHGLQVLGRLIAVAAVAGAVVPPLWQLTRFLRVPGRIHLVKRNHLLATGGLIAMLAFAALVIPLPRSVSCSVEIQPRDAKNVFVEVPAVLEQVHVQPGQPVKKGEPLAELSSPDVVLEDARLAGQEAEIEARLAALDRQRHGFDEGANEAREQFPQVRESLENVRALRALKQRDMQRLKLVAPCDGTVMPPPQVAAAPHTDGRLVSWSGTPLKPQNLGAVLGTSGERSLLCRVGDPKRLEAVLVIDQADIELVREGQAVRIQIDQLPGESLLSTVDRVAQRELELTSRRMSSKTGGQLQTQTDANGAERPTSTSYQARALLTDEEAVLRLGARGKARISVKSQTLAARLWRYMSQTFQLTL